MIQNLLPYIKYREVTCHEFYSHREYSSQVNVVLGDLLLSAYSEHHVSVASRRTFIHPDYGYNNDADIALIQLTEPVSFTDHVRPACLADLSNETVHYTRCLISGWGNTEIGEFWLYLCSKVILIRCIVDSLKQWIVKLNTIVTAELLYVPGTLLQLRFIPNNFICWIPLLVYSPDALQKAVVQLFENERCNDLYGGEITDRMICAGYERGDIDTCQVSDRKCFPSNVTIFVLLN